MIFWGQEKHLDSILSIARVHGLDQEKVSKYFYKPGRCTIIDVRNDDGNKNIVGFCMYNPDWTTIKVKHICMLLEWHYEKLLQRMIKKLNSYHKKLVIPFGENYLLAQELQCQELAFNFKGHIAYKNYESTLISLK